MKRLLEKSEFLVQRTPTQKRRYLYKEINWDNRLIGIKGSRGTGKTTLLLQKLKELGLPPTQATYWSLDDLFFTTHSLVEIAEQFRKEGGTHLFLDEVHKYENWAVHLKNLYDFNPDLYIVFTGSSIIDMARESADLSRRMLMYQLYGLSFREYLYFNEIGDFGPISLSEIRSKERKWRQRFFEQFKPLAHFAEYLQYGYYPFSLEDRQGYVTRLQQFIRLIVEYDMAEIQGFDIRNAKKMLQLLYILSDNVPFQPNITSIAAKSNIHRNSVISYLQYLEQAQLIRLLYASGKNVAVLQKPEKVYLDNPNLAYALSMETPNKGNLRETFFLSQIMVRHKATYPKKGFFLVDGKYIFEVGGKNKTNEQDEQIKEAVQGYVVGDDLEYPVNKLPLWLFGFLY